MVLFVELVLVAYTELETVDAVVVTVDEPVEELLTVASSAVDSAVADAKVEVVASPVADGEAVDSASVDEVVTLPSSCRGSGCATWATTV